MVPHLSRHTMFEESTNEHRNIVEANRALECLYDIEKIFSTTPTSATSYHHALERIENFLGFSGAAICLSNAGQQTAVMLASTPSEDEARLAFCQTRNCRACLGGHKPHEAIAVGGARVLQVPMVTSRSRYGVLSIKLPKHAKLNTRQLATLNTLGTRLAQFAETAKLRIEAEQQSLREERLAMARDLHDSLAHTLAYLNIQLLRLRNQLASEGKTNNFSDILTELSTGLSDANVQVRELITTFRLNMPQGSFEAAITHLAGQATARSKIHVQVNNAIPGALLTANEQINLIQILKESLTNTERHASAKSIWIRLYLRDDGNLTMEIEDDGIGMPLKRSANSRNKRYGLGIIGERAQILGGKIRFSRRKPTGTLVVLTFAPKSCQSLHMLENTQHEQQSS